LWNEFHETPPSLHVYKQFSCWNLILSNAFVESNLMYFVDLCWEKVNPENFILLLKLSIVVCKGRNTCNARLQLCYRKLFIPKNKYNFNIRY
jgi:hypothetical protein